MDKELIQSINNMNVEKLEKYLRLMEKYLYESPENEKVIRYVKLRLDDLKDEYEDSLDGYDSDESDVNQDENDRNDDCNSCVENRTIMMNLIYQIIELEKKVALNEPINKINSDCTLTARQKANKRYYQRNKEKWS